MSVKKYTYNDYYKKATEKGFELVSKEKDFKNASSLMKYICPNHRDKGIQQTTLGRLLEGKGCYYCGVEKTASKRRKQISLELINEVESLCEERDFTYINIERKQIHGANKICVYFICNSHKDKGVQIVPIANFRRNKKCQYCVHKNLSKNDIKKLVDEKLPHIQILSDYSYIHDEVNYLCTIHNYRGHTSPANLIKGRGCYYCGLEKMSQMSKLPIQEVDKRIKNINPHFERIGDYVSSTSLMKIKCNKCDYTWDSSLVNLRFCPNCEKDKMYKGEHMIFDILQENGINFETQKKYDDCKNIRPLSFDFYLPKFNTCIEYNGQQHYKPVDYFGGINSFNKQVKNDNIKKKYCQDNGIGLITIPYYFDTKEKISNYIFSQL